MSTASPPETCPACGSYATIPVTDDAVCGRCALPLGGPVAGELRDLNTALTTLDAERQRLLGRRARLLAGPRPTGPLPPPPLPDASDAAPVDVRNVLLSLGGLLLAVAAVVFTVINWGHLGIAGRTVVLAALTLTAMAVPMPLLRRALTATAEVVACLGAVLLLLDCYAVHRVLLPGADGTAYAACATAVTSVVWAAYAVALRPRAGRCGLRLPARVALVLAQAPLVLWALAAHSALACAYALLVTAPADIAVAAWRGAGGRTGPRRTAVAAAAATGLLGLLTAAALALRADGPGEALRAGAALLGAAGCASVIGHRAASWGPPAGDGRPGARAGGRFVPGAVAGIAVVVAVSGLVRTLVPGEWVVPWCLAGAVATLAGSAVARRAGAHRDVVAGTALGPAVVHALAAAWALVPLATAMLGPLEWVGAVWSGAPAGARAATAPHLWWGGSPAVAVVTAAGLAVVPAAVGRWHRAWSVRAFGVAVVFGTLVAAGLPAAVDLPYPVAVASRLVVAVALLAVPASTRARPGAGRVPPAAALVVALTAIGWSLADRVATPVVLAVLTAAFATAAARWRADPSRSAVAGPAAVGCAAGLAWAGPMAAGGPAHEAAFAVLAVAALAQWIGHRAAAAPVEWAGGAVVLPALALASGDAPALSAVLGLAGVLAAAVALRADRRRVAGHLSTVLLVAACWVRLGASGVAVPEAYTLPVTVAALVVGRLRRRGSQVSSWGAYGPGLAVTLLPSAVAVWGDTHWLRPLLLGAGALVVTLLGARHRLRAPLLLGGAALVLDALHELAPVVLQALGFLPRWLPVALVGAVLLMAGATYERRLAEIRRLRDALRRLG